MKIHCLKQRLHVPLPVSSCLRFAIDIERLEPFHGNLLPSSPHIPTRRQEKQHKIKNIVMESVVWTLAFTRREVHSKFANIV